MAIRYLWWIPVMHSLTRNVTLSFQRPSAKTLVATLEEYEDIKDTGKIFHILFVLLICLQLLWNTQQTPIPSFTILHCDYTVTGQ